MASIRFFFSTHVISDLEKCADDIIYIKDGKIIANSSVNEFEKKYFFYSGDEALLDRIDKPKLGYVRIHNGKFELVQSTKSLVEIPGAEKRQATLEEIMVFLERGDEK